MPRRRVFSETLGIRRAGAVRLRLFNFSRRKRAERSTSIEIRVTTAERKALIDVCGVGEAS
jgi:hypothetical protein